MTTKQEILRERLSEIIKEFPNRYNINEERLRSLVNDFGMSLPDFEPSDTIGLSKKQTDFFKSVAKFQVEEEG